MTKLLPLALHAACTAALAFMAGHASAQTPPPGRTTFDQSGCRSCHAYSSRRGAPSVRDMLVTFEGDPNLALKSITQTAAHASDSMAAAVSEDDRRAIAEWIAGAAFPEPEPATPTAPLPNAVTAPAPVAEVPAPPVARAPVEAVTLAPQVAPEVAAPPPSIARRVAAGHLVGLAIEPGKKTDRLVISLSGKDPDELNIESVDGTLVISLPGFDRADRVPETLEAAKQSRAVGAVRSRDDNGTLVLTVTARNGDLKYSATQSRNRLAIELTSVPAKKKPAPTVVAAAPAATAAIAKTVAETAKTAAKIAAVKPDVPTKASPAEGKAKTEPAAKVDAKAKQQAEAQERKEAEAKALAKKEAEAKALAKKEADAKAAQLAAAKEADDKSKRELTAAAKAEADMLASLKASAEAIRAGSGTDGEKAAKTGRSDRSKLKAPEKFRDEACPPIASSDPIGTVDEARAKDIIDRVGCPQCHAYVQKKTGPPFKKVFEKVKGNPSCVIQRLKKNKEHNEEGVTDDLKGPEFKIVADYLATRAK